MNCSGVIGENSNDIDYFTFHQANLFMNEKIRKKLKLHEEQVPYSLDEFGNTSCASIPLTLVVRCAGPRFRKLRHVGCGFGVGLSWGAVRFDTDKIAVPELYPNIKIMNYNPFALTGKTVFVTGASSGIGRSTGLSNVRGLGRNLQLTVLMNNVRCRNITGIGW